jgi:hypothetical protein
MGWVHSYVLADDESTNVTATPAELGTSGPWSNGMAAHLSGEVYNPSESGTLSVLVQSSRKPGVSARWTTRLSFNVAPLEAAPFELETIGLNYVRVMCSSDGVAVTAVLIFLQRNVHLQVR